MIKTLSPHYLSIPLTNPLSGVVCDSYVAKFYIWNGSKVAAPSTPEYEMTKINAAGSSTTDNLNISRIVSDYIEFDFTGITATSLVDGDNQVWVKIEVYYDDVPSVPGFYSVQLATKGYGYFMEGENPQVPANKVLLTGDEFKVSRQGMFVLPLMGSEPTVGTRTLSVTSLESLGLNTYYATASANFGYSQLLLFVRMPGETEWQPTTVVSANIFIAPIAFIDVEFEYRGAAYDTVTAQVIYSPTYTFTP